MTEWRAIPGFEGKYEASAEGIRSLTRPDTLGRPVEGKLLTPHIIKGGYPRVKLYPGDGSVVRICVHVLVALAFHGPCPEGLQVRHRNGRSNDFRPENLHYGTRSDNELDKVRHGTHNESRKTHCPDGHEYSAENTYRIPSRPAKRYCIACRPKYAQNRKARTLTNSLKEGD